MGGIPLVRPPYTPRNTNTIADLIARQGQIQAQGAAASGDIWGRAVSNLGQIGAGALQAHQEQKAAQTEHERVQSVFNDPEAQKDPKRMFLGLAGIIGIKRATAAIEGLGAVQKYQQGQQAGTVKPADALNMLTKAVPGFMALDEETRAQAYPIIRDPARALYPDANLPDEYDSAIVDPIAQSFMEQDTDDGGFTLGPGDVRFGPGGEQIAAVAAKPDLPFEEQLRRKRALAQAGRAPEEAPKEGPLQKIQDPDLRTAAGMILSSVDIPAVRRGAAADFMGQLAEAGDTENLKRAIRSAALDSLGVDDQRQVTGRMDTAAVISGMEDILRNLEAEGVDTGIISGTVEDFARKLGMSTNPKLAELGSQLDVAMIQYRRATTGVQFSQREAADYKRLFPNYKQDLPVNLAVISGLRKSMNSYNKAFWTRKLGEKGAIAVGAIEDERPPWDRDWKE